ncbi:MAG: right-handed parallel beta-helix repeat-containing protein [Thermoleophilaceae bacterium]|nr:right-handed parallel beta-helix repeat-containing protein [Thermoleophilaceae bacterium]
MGRAVRMSAIVAGAALVLAAPAFAVSYPPPKNPGGVGKPPKGPHRTLHVGKHARYHSIQKAVNAARPGDTVKVAHGVYHEGVKIVGRRKRYLKLIGDPRHPEKVVLDLRGVKGTAAQNGVIVNGADAVTLRGLTAMHYKGNGFFVVNATGYKLDRLIAKFGGVYGIYAFNTKGGSMTNSVAAWNNDGGFYIGQTPIQTKPLRTIAGGLKSYGNVIGWSGTNMRYVTITKSQFFNNGTGIVPNALDSEKWPPPEDNVITHNEVFWNNFNYYQGAPFTLRKPATGDVPYPVGVGILLFGGRRNRVENNDVYGNWLVGVGMLQQFLLKQEDARDLQDNRIQGNRFGLNGTDLNGRDLFYDGNGSGNCFGGNIGVSAVFPADGSTLATCPFSGPNHFEQNAQIEAVGWSTNADHTAGWVRHPHAPKPGYNALEVWKEGKDIWGGR